MVAKILDGILDRLEGGERQQQQDGQRIFSDKADDNVRVFLTPLYPDKETMDEVQSKIEQYGYA